MAEYRQVQSSFWKDSLVLDSFSAEDKYFYLYALTNLHTNACGCYDVSVGRIAVEMGYSPETVNSILERFEETYDLIRYDRSTNELLIINWGKYNWTESPKFRSMLEKEVKNIKNDEFRAYLIGVITEKHEFRYPISTQNTVSEVEIPSNSMFSLVSNNNDNNSNTNLESNSNSEEVKSQVAIKKKRNKYEDTPEFSAFWDAYPNHKGKTVARQAFERVDVPLQTLLDAIEVQKHSRQWTKDDGEFIPNPSTWLNQRRWEDSMKVNIQGEDRYYNLKRIAEEFDDE